MARLLRYMREKMTKTQGKERKKVGKKGEGGSHTHAGVHGVRNVCVPEPCPQQVVQSQECLGFLRFEAREDREQLGSNETKREERRQNHIPTRVCTASGISVYPSLALSRLFSARNVCTSSALSRGTGSVHSAWRCVNRTQCGCVSE